MALKKERWFYFLLGALFGIYAEKWNWIMVDKHRHSAWYGIQMRPWYWDLIIYGIGFVLLIIALFLLRYALRQRSKGIEAHKLMASNSTLVDQEVWQECKKEKQRKYPKHQRPEVKGKHLKESVAKAKPQLSTLR